MVTLDAFEDYLKISGKSGNTIKGYVLNVKIYLKWFQDSFGQVCTVLYRQNILEFVSYLKNVKNQNAKTINHKLSSLRSYNEFLIAEGVQEDAVIHKTDMIKVQTAYASPTQVSEIEVKQFMQKVLGSKDSRNYAIVTLLAYTGMRISEALSIRLKDLNLQTGECIIRNGKGDKQRDVIMNSKLILAIREYMKNRLQYTTASSSPYLFVSKKNDTLDRTVVNRIFQRYSKVITPHQLRHYYCTNALEKGFTIHEVANQAGHSNINTTLLYTNPDKAKLKKKMELL
ncbi:tyrosine-type recombinase/integrase [Paenibacillus mesotrionivorans]|uniref:Tyrosine-type recombinase/integrase n=1 Tax=Paenibacillus mesotrionivorans TaxID=3160968 RepID=A0ACC7NYA1_9BACL